MSRDFDFDTLWRSLDVNGDGYIEYEQFRVATMNRAQLLKQENIDNIFRILDKDNDGFISAREL